MRKKRFVLCIYLINLYLIATAPPLARAASINLVWKPYLQQLTDTSVIVLWVTQTGASPEVRYSTDTSYNLTAGGSTRSGTSGTQLHRVELTGLQPNTTYNYKIYVDNQDLLPTESLWFQTAPSTGSDAPFTFIAFGDYGDNSDSQKRLRDQLLLDPLNFNFILTTGDNAYGDGTYFEFDANVFQIYQDLFSKAAIFPTLGNHDYHTDSGAPYLDIFDLPQNAWRTGDIERYYSFDYGNVHFVALDSNAPLDVDDSAASNDMFDWLRDDLSQTAQPWKIVAFHHPAYSTGFTHGSDGRVQARLVPIFEAYGVDLVFNGHDHLYQRSQPLRGGQVTTAEQGGIVYIVSGAGAAADRACGSAAWLAIAYCSKSYGLYSRIMINGSSLTVAAVNDSGTLKDSRIISKTNVAIGGLGIGGPTTGLVGFGYAFTASASPITVTLPITYVWQATDQATVTNTGGLANILSFTWNTTDTQTITVTATNAWATITNTHTIAIVPVASQVHLPLVLKP